MVYGDLQLSELGGIRTRNMGWGQREERKMMLSLGRACEVLRDHYGVHFPKERVPVTNGKYKSGPQDRDRD